MLINRLIYLIFGLCIIKRTYQMDLVVLKTGNLVGPGIVKRQAFQSPQSRIPTVHEFIVKTHVANRFAETSVVSEVENVHKYPKQTTFSVVLPERALISGFSMEIDGTIYKAFVKEKKEAESLYGQSVSSGQTAAHVAVSARNSNRFTVNVYVEPESKVRFNLTYEELLLREKGLYEIVANIQPGQVVRKLEVEVEIKESRPLLFVTTPSVRSGNKLILQKNPNLDPDAAVQISNTTARVKFYPDVNRQLQFACAGLGNKEYDGFAGQFVVQYDIERDPQGGETLFQDGFFINYFAPPNLEPIPKHFVFVLDTSGSMYGTKIVQLKEAMMYILTKLYKGDKFSIVQYDNSVYLWNTNLTPVDVIPKGPKYGNLDRQLNIESIPDSFEVTSENVNMARRIIGSFVAHGVTNTIGALEVGLYLIKRIQQAHPNGYQPIMLFLTDGLPFGNTITDPTEIISLISNINSREYNTPIYSLSIGDDADWSFLQRLSLSTGAVPTRIYFDGTDNSDVSAQLKYFYEKISTPVLKNITFNNLPASVQLTQLKFPIYFNGSEITIAGKGVSEKDKNPIKVTATGKKGAVELEAKIGIPLTKLERIWAYLTVKQLLDEYHASNSQINKTQYSKLALEMALKYSLVTEVTSLVVVKPNDINTAVSAVDASYGIFPESPDELPRCSNVLEILKNSTNEVTSGPNGIITSSRPPVRTETMEATVSTSDSIQSTIDQLVTSTTETPTIEKIIVPCQYTRFGCCYDGTTAASGFNYSGCDPSPKEEHCMLPITQGRCTTTITDNYQLKWGYDKERGECRAFWYAGCEGTDNRFASKQDCETICINSNKNRCKLPIVLGHCTGYHLSWFYDQKKDECVKFVYSGCSGNANRFPNKLECLQACASPSKKMVPQDVCSLPQSKGTCWKYEIKHYYDVTEGRCLRFWFGGCGGNENRFDSSVECGKICVNPEGRDICQLPAVKGRCSWNVTKWYFDKHKNVCTQFVYGGCHGNKNNFETKEGCQRECF